jgi:hypothetical protein
MFSAEHFGICFAVKQFMNFYPVYRLCRTNGSFSRVGSLLGTSYPDSYRISPHLLGHLMAQFKQKPGETILLGPRCEPIGKDAMTDEDR